MITFYKVLISRVFSRRILSATPIPASEREQTRIALIEPTGRLVADTVPNGEGTVLRRPELETRWNQKKMYLSTGHEGREMLVGFARSPGFETYATGWGSIILQDLSA